MLDGSHSLTHSLQDLVVSGASEAGLPAAYQSFLSTSPHYVPPTSYWTRFGASMFLSWCTPIWRTLDWITHANTGKDGNVPWYIVLLVQTVIFIVWLIHDTIFAPIFGRGDGIGQARRTVSPKNSSQYGSGMNPLICEEKPKDVYGTV